MSNPKPWWKLSAADEGYVSLADQEEIYKKVTGDRHYSVGFSRRFEEWVLKNPRSELTKTG